MGDISLNSKHQRKLEVIALLTSDKVTEEEAGALLRFSVRTIRRLRQRWEEQGVSCVLHGNTGRVPAHKTPVELTQRILELAGEGGRYHDFNVCHMRSMLRRHEHLLIGRSTLDRLLKEAGVRKPNRATRRRIYRRRQRSAQEGFMLLIDGSPHDWLEKRGPRMCLIGAIDDATGRVVHLHFWPTECLQGYLLMLQSIAVQFGLPALLYHDKHTILRSPKEASIEDELAGRKPMSQFQEVLSLLGVEGVAAHSPQAKGRIERLWETLQERLVKELRLANATTREEANAFLPGFIRDYNDEFAIPPADPEPAWVTIDPKMDLAYHFAQKEQRLVRSDHTVAWNGATLAIRRDTKQQSLAGKKVSVHTDPHGQRWLYYGKTRLAYEQLADQTMSATTSSRTTQEKNAAPAAPTRPAETTALRSKPSGNPRTRAWLHASA